MKRILLAVLVIGMFGFTLPASAGVGDWLYSFFFPTKASLKQWKEKIFAGKTVYEIKMEKGKGYLSGKASGHASALYTEVPKWDLKKNPILQWKWRARAHPTRQPNINKQSKDYALRLYVIFPALVFLNSKAIAYTWDPLAPVGKIMDSDLSPNLKIFVVQSGAVTDKWVLEKRNVYEDYFKAFGVHPKSKPKAIAVLTDGEHTKTESIGNWLEIYVGNKGPT